MATSVANLSAALAGDENRQVRHGFDRCSMDPSGTAPAQGSFPRTPADGSAAGHQRNPLYYQRRDSMATAPHHLSALANGLSHLPAMDPGPHLGSAQRAAPCSGRPKMRQAFSSHRGYSG